MNVINLIGGIPAHPLIVHAAVIVLPLSVIVALLLAFWPKSRNVWTWSALGILAAGGTAAAWIARITGEELAMLVGYPGKHAELGENTTIAASVYLIAVLGWMIMSSRLGRKLRMREEVSALLSAITIVTGISVTISLIMTGHSGAEATWKNRVDAALTPSVSESVNEDSDRGAAEEAAPEDGLAFELTETVVSEYFATSEFCWTIINDVVYDVTPFIEDHRGGRGNILDLCGKDGSDIFASQHGGQPSPEATLGKYAIAPLETIIARPAEELPADFVTLLQVSADR